MEFGWEIVSNRIDLLHVLDNFLCGSDTEYIYSSFLTEYALHLSMFFRSYSIEKVFQKNISTDLGKIQPPPFQSFFLCDYLFEINDQKNTPTHTQKEKKDALKQA